jgi:hypothetical protein
MNAQPSLLTRRRIVLAEVAFLFSWHTGSYCSRGGRVALVALRPARPQGMTP